MIDGKIIKKSMDPTVDISDYDYVADTTIVDGERIITVKAMLKDDTPWAKKGFVVASEQFVVEPYQFPTALASQRKAPKVRR